MIFSIYCWAQPRLTSLSTESVLRQAGKSFVGFEKIIEVTLPEFIKVPENFETIPISRIKKITKNNTILFEKNTKLSTSMNNLVDY